MALIDKLLGGGIGAIATGAKDIASIFSSNSEEDAKRAQEVIKASMGYDLQALTGAQAQFLAEFKKADRNWFDSLINGLNRLPRPALALGTIGLFVFAFANPTGFAIAIQSLALIPAELWAMMGGIVTFYYGSRVQSKGHEKGINDLRIAAATELTKAMISGAKKSAPESTPSPSSGAAKTQGRPS